MPHHLRTCFFIAPISEPNTPERKRTDQLFRFVVKPILSVHGYESEAAHELNDPGIITSHVIQRIVDADLVVADLTGHNPNVFYELALRHATKKPFIQLIQPGEKLPFDVAGIRTIPVDLQDIESIDHAKVQIREQLAVMERDPDSITTPLTRAADFGNLLLSDNPAERSLAELSERIVHMKASVDALAAGRSLAELSDAVQQIKKSVDTLAAQSAAQAAPPPGLLDLTPQPLSNDRLLSSSEVVVALAKLEFVSRHIDPTFILGVNRSGWLLSRYLAHRLDIGNDRIVECNVPPPPGKIVISQRTKLSGEVLVIDDVSRSGRSLSDVREHVGKVYKKARLSVVTIVKVVDEYGKSKFPVDYSPFMSTAERVQFPWNPPERRELSDEDLSPVFRIGDHATAAIDLSPGDIKDLIELIRLHLPNQEMLLELDNKRTQPPGPGRRKR